MRRMSSSRSRNSTRAAQSSVCEWRMLYDVVACFACMFIV